MKKLLLTFLAIGISIVSYSQGTMATADNLAEGATASGTVTDNNNGPVNIPFHFYKVQLAGNGVIRIITQITNSSLTSAGAVWINILFKDSTLWTRKQVVVVENSTLVDTFLVTGAEADDMYIGFENYGVVYGGPFNYTTQYELLNVESNNEIEPNDFHDQSQVLHPGDVVNGHISYKSDAYYVDLYDYYELIMPENGQVDLEISWQNLALVSGFQIPAPSVYLYGKDSAYVGWLDHTSSAYSSILTVANNVNSPFGSWIYDTMHVYGKAADTIRISIYNYFTGWGIGYCGAYTLKYTMSDQVPCNEVEPNNSRPEATTINIGDTIHGLIAYSNGNFFVDTEDNFKLVRPSGDSLRIYISAINKFKYDSLSVNPTVYAYDKNGNSLMVYSSTGASSAGGQLIGNVWQQPVDVLISDTMTIRNIPTDSIYIKIYNASSAFAYELMPLSPFTSINDLSAKNSFSVYPNPANEKVLITMDNAVNEVVEINLYTLTGAKVQSLYEGRLLSLEKALDLPKVQSGIYFISIKTKSGSESIRKIVIRND